MKKQIAVVTGANRGLGRATAEKLSELRYHVVLAGRNKSELKTAAQQIEQKGGSAEAFVLDVSQPDTIQFLVDKIDKEFGHLDVLVNNAGIFPESDRAGHPGDKALSIPAQMLMDTFETNTVGPFRLCQALMPLLQKSEQPRIVNVSSGMGGLTEMGSGYPAYRLSKSALNALTRLLAAEYSHSSIKINSVCPGWVKTDMGGSRATRSIEEGIQGIVWAATLPPNGPSGGFFRDGKPLAW